MCNFRQDQVIYDLSCWIRHVGGRITDSITIKEKKENYHLLLYYSTWVELIGIKWHLVLKKNMNWRLKKEVRWSTHNCACHTGTRLNVCMHEIKTLSVLKWLPVWMCVCELYFTVYIFMCSLYSIYMCILLYSTKDIRLWHLIRGKVCLFRHDHERYLLLLTAFRSSPK